MDDADPVGDKSPLLIPSSPSVSAQMSRHPRKDTTIEMAVRRALHARGLRYRVHHPVPGMPRRTIDIAFPGIRVAVFLDGCFWHACPMHGRVPRSNLGWWAAKLNRTQRRDEDTVSALNQLDWQVLRFWAHEPDDQVVAKIVDEVRLRRAGSHRVTGPIGRTNPRSPTKRAVR
jgi:DNA mismatch endonuclease, patch repair protein